MCFCFPVKTKNEFKCNSVFQSPNNSTYVWLHDRNSIMNCYWYIAFWNTDKFLMSQGRAQINTKWTVGFLVAWQIVSFVVSPLVLYLFILINICGVAWFSSVSSWLGVSGGEHEAVMEIAAFGAATAWGTQCQFWEFWNQYKSGTGPVRSYLPIRGDISLQLTIDNFLLAVSESEFQSFSV